MNMPASSVFGHLNDKFSRRDFLKVFGAGLGYASLGPVLSGCGAGESGGVQAAPLFAPLSATPAEFSTLKRTSFGVRRDELIEMQELGIDAYLERQLDYISIDDAGLESSIRRLFPFATRRSDQLIDIYQQNGSADIVSHMVSAVQYRQTYSRRQLYEVMVEFWTNHFSIYLLKGYIPVLKPEDDMNVIRAHALGNFGEMLHASAGSPAMIAYLDNASNKGSAPNENYARELLELHTMGVDGGYTEADVKEVARCFTGWAFRYQGESDGPFGEFVFRGSWHDDDAKVVLGNYIPAGGGVNDGNQVLDILATHPSTAKFLATKLCRRFISDNPDAASIDAVASVFTQSGGDIPATLRALFATDPFRNSGGLKMIRPAEYLAGLVRALAPDAALPDDNGELFRNSLAVLGQLPYHWMPPDGYPDKQEFWAGTGAFLNRWRLSFLSFAPLDPKIDAIQINYHRLLDGAETPTTVVDALVGNILMRTISATDRDLLIE